MSFLQKIIHLIDAANGSRFARYVLVFLCVTLLALVYDLNGYRNLATTEAMDAAQIARNLAAGKGFSTQFVRPLSLFLFRRTAEKNGTGTNGLAVATILRGPVPDISNAPLYPAVLAGLMKVCPFQYSVNLARPFWSVVDPASAVPGARMFWRYEPDFLITIFNQALVIIVIMLAFAWARRMFDVNVAWTSTFFLFGTELLWRFSVSGLSTMLLLLIFMCLVWCLTLLESETAEPRRGRAAPLVLSAMAGLILGLGGLTNYAFIGLLGPVLIWIVIYLRAQAVPACLLVVAVCLLVAGPWCARNYNLSGTLFGTATYKVLDGTALFPGHHLERSLNPDLQVFPALIGRKFYDNVREIVEKNLFKLGGSFWISGFFLAGLMVGFRNPALRRMRHFLLLSFGALLLAQALGRSQLSEDSPQINSENLLVLLLPLVVIYAVSMFFVLLDQIQFPAAELRIYSQGLFGILVCLPLAASLLLSRPVSPVVYPPYHPPTIQRTASWLHEDEWMMSDIPWAVAWYGDRTCVWLSLSVFPPPAVANPHEDFFSINEIKPVSALYLTPRTMDGRFLTDWVRTSENNWGNFITRCLILRDVPDAFPLHEMPNGFFPEQLFLADSKRWQKDAPEKNAPAQPQPAAPK